MFSVKYNTYRNLGFLCEELKEHENALNYLLSAVKMDDTDIFTLNRIGYLALQIKRPYLAQYAFQKCQELNPNHWLSMNGLLDALCESQSIGSAYGQALHCLNRNPAHRKAIDVLVEVNEDFPEMIPMLEKMYKKGDFSLEDHRHSGREKYFTIKYTEPIELTDTAVTSLDTSLFQLDHLDWLSIGKLITKLHTHSVANDHSLTQMYQLDDFFQEKQSEACHIEGLSDLSPDDLSKASFPEPSPGMFDLFNNEDFLDIPLTPGNTITELNGGDLPEDDVHPEAMQVDPTENETEITGPGDNNPDMSQNESTVQSENTDTEGKKPDDALANADVAALKSDSKRRRRGSELTVLEQWGWHKNRRSNRKKVEQAPVEQIDPTINGFLRRILPQYFEKSYDTTASLSENNHESNNSITAVTTDDDPNNLPKQNSLEDFNVLTKDTFDQFIAELRGAPFDLFIAMQKYLQYLSSLWTQHMPEEVRQVFVGVYEIYRTIIDYDTLNLLSDDEVEFNIKIALFYLELVINDQTRPISTDILKICTVLRFYVGFFLFNNVYLEFSSRLLWIFVSMNVNQNNFEQALDYLESVSRKKIDFAN